jgi:F-type H+-transporting ATPase subunit gamma
MSSTIHALRRRMQGVDDLEAVVRTMKTMAAVNISYYERAARSLAQYARTVELGLSVCFRHVRDEAPPPQKPVGTGALVFGSDQGMVGQFNDRLSAFVTARVGTARPSPMIWVVGERIQTRLEDAGFQVSTVYQTPGSVAGITPLVGEITLHISRLVEAGKLDELFVFRNQPKTRAGYESTIQRLLPLDREWESRLRALPWPTQMFPETLGPTEPILAKLVQEHLFVSLFRACAESLAAENASRLSAMQRAEHNIGELLDRLHLEFNRRRQSSIDEELFDVISGFEALTRSALGEKGGGTAA